MKLTNEEYKEMIETLDKCGLEWFSEQDDLTYDLYVDTGYMMPLKVLKAPKKSKEYAEYYPNEHEDKLLTNIHKWLRGLIEENNELKEKIEQ